MTTYLATAELENYNEGRWHDEEISFAFCAPSCRAYHFTARAEVRNTWRDDDSYEFDETCANCGSLIPASTIWEEEIAGVTYLVAKIGNPQ